MSNAERVGSGELLLTAAFSYVIFSLVRLLACIVSFEQSLCYVAYPSAISLLAHINYVLNIWPFADTAVSFRSRQCMALKKY